MGANHLQFVTAVWGKGHTQVFLDLGLPSLLSAGNIPGMVSRNIYKYHLFTQKADFETIETALPFKRLQETTETLSPLSVSSCLASSNAFATVGP